MTERDVKRQRIVISPLFPKISFWLMLVLGCLYLFQSGWALGDRSTLAVGSFLFPRWPVDLALGLVWICGAFVMDRVYRDPSGRYQIGDHPEPSESDSDALPPDRPTDDDAS